MKLGFGESHYLNNDITSRAEPIFHQVLMKIPNVRVAKQFILEELEAAFLASKDASNSIAKELEVFVANSGFYERDFKSAMMKSFDEVDGVNGPQQTLLNNLSALSLYGVNGPTRALIRIEVVNRIINRFKGQL